MVVALAPDAAADAHLVHDLQCGLVGYRHVLLGAQGHGDLPVSAAVGRAGEHLRQPGGLGGDGGGEGLPLGADHREWIELLQQGAYIAVVYRAGGGGEEAAQGDHHAIEQNGFVLNGSADGGHADPHALGQLLHGQGL